MVDRVARTLGLAYKRNCRWSDSRSVCGRTLNWIQITLVVAIISMVVLFSGCATLPAYSTEESVKDRESCLKKQHVWVEMWDKYTCVSPTPVKMEETHEIESALEGAV